MAGWVEGILVVVASAMVARAYLAPKPALVPVRVRTEQRRRR